jgi:hypothetical protein
MKVFKCELCGKVSDDPMALYGDNKKYCEPCNQRLLEIRLNERKIARGHVLEQYGPIIENQAKVVDLCEYLYTLYPEEWSNTFGELGATVLTKALER